MLQVVIYLWDAGAGATPAASLGVFLGRARELAAKINVFVQEVSDSFHHVRLFLRHVRFAARHRKASMCITLARIRACKFRQCLHHLSFVRGVVVSPRPLFLSNSTTTPTRPSLSLSMYPTQPDMNDNNMNSIIATTAGADVYSGNGGLLYICW